MASLSKVVAEWTISENGAETIHTALIQSRFCDLKCVWNRAIYTVSSKNMIEETQYNDGQCETNKQKQKR